MLLGDLLKLGHVEVGRPVPPARLPDRRLRGRQDHLGSARSARSAPYGPRNCSARRARWWTDTEGVARKTTTIVVMDFGRITIRVGLHVHTARRRFHEPWTSTAAPHGAL
ncbi:hypothetical protein H9W91_05175 [Streptomyces alfalfae]|nr:hypothetical protein H9W91_05175 [Streptomyces alfalfae]